MMRWRATAVPRTVRGLLAIGLAILGRPAAAQAPDSPATTTSAPATAQPAAEDQKRIADLFALLEESNPPAARKIGAGELLRLGAAAEARLVVVLRSTNHPARIAVASALAEAPHLSRPAFLDPLLEMLIDEDADVRAAARQAVAVARDPSVVSRLEALLNDSARPLAQRRSVVDALGMTTRFEAVAALMKIVETPGSPLLSAALDALGSATAQDFRGDVAAARQWWEETRVLPREDWLRLQIDRLVRQNRLLRSGVNDVEARLVAMEREALLRAPEAERAQLLNGFLTDGLSAVRLLGLDEAQNWLSTQHGLPADAVARLRVLLQDPEPSVRASAASVVATLRDPQDEAVFLQMLESERAAVVRKALINALGYVGGNASVERLLGETQDVLSETIREAIASLGRLAERGVLDAARRERIATALLEVFQRSSPEQLRLREQTLWAMSRVGDARFVDVAIAAMAPGVPTVVRIAAIRCAGALAEAEAAQGTRAISSAPAGNNGNGAGEPGLRQCAERVAEVLTPLLSDPDTPVRRSAIEMIGRLPTNERRLAALWERSFPATESDEEARGLAWKAVTGPLARLSPDALDRWLARIPADLPARDQMCVQLLSRAEAQVADGGAEPDLFAIRMRLGAAYARLGRSADAIRTYLSAFDDAASLPAEVRKQAGFEAAHAAVLAAAVDDTLITALSQRGALPDGAALWSVLRPELEARLTVDTPAAVAPILDSFRAHFGAGSAPEVRAEVEGFSRQVREMQGAAVP